jgi:DNA-binding NtrC family response regulator
MGGTLFLDEIGEMPMSVQAKLLRFLENRKFMRVGGTTKVAVDVRLVTATLQPIEGEVKAGRFRADLFYRIQGITLRMPLLRERQADIGPLVAQFVAQASAKFGTEPPRITRAAMAAMRAYSWPGNVRELRNAVELLCVLRGGKIARLLDLPAVIQQAAPENGASRDEGAGGRGGAADGGALGGGALGGGALGGGARREVLEVRLDRPLDETIERILRAALEAEGGNRSRAARRLDISLRTMQRHAARFGRGRLED